MNEIPPDKKQSLPALFATFPPHSPEQDAQIKTTMNRFCADNKDLMSECRTTIGRQTVKDKLTESIRDKTYLFPELVLSLFNRPKEQEKLMNTLYHIAIRLNQNVTRNATRNATRKRKRSGRDVEQVPEDGPVDGVAAKDTTREDDGPTDIVDAVDAKNTIQEDDSPTNKVDATANSLIIDGPIALRHQDRPGIIWLKNLSAYVNDGAEILDSAIKISSLSYEKFMADARCYFDPEKEGLRMQVTEQGIKHTWTIDNEDEWGKALRSGYNEDKKGYLIHIVMTGDKCQKYPTPIPECTRKMPRGRERHSNGSWCALVDY